MRFDEAKKAVTRHDALLEKWRELDDVLSLLWHGIAPVDARPLMNTLRETKLQHAFISAIEVLKDKLRKEIDAIEDEFNNEQKDETDAV